MTTYTIDNENSFTAFASVKEAKSKLDAERFSSTKELARLAEKWPAPRLVEIWNTLPGVTPVKKFTSRKKAVFRIWAAIQNLDPHVGEHRTRVAPKKARPAKQADHRDDASSAREGSKKAEILALLRREGGATLQELMAATDWQAHSVRGFLSGTLRKKMGLTVESQRAYGRRTPDGGSRIEAAHVGTLFQDNPGAQKTNAGYDLRGDTRGAVSAYKGTHHEKSSRTGRNQRVSAGPGHTMMPGALDADHCSEDKCDDQAQQKYRDRDLIHIAAGNVPLPD